MGPKQPIPTSGALFQQALAPLINLEHSLVKLSELIDWQVFELIGKYLKANGQLTFPQRQVVQQRHHV